MTTAKPIHGAPVPPHIAHGWLAAPDRPCAFKLGDIVTYQNDYGLKFPNKRVVGFAAASPVLPDNFIYLDSAAWWFPHKESSLSLQS